MPTPTGENKKCGRKPKNYKPPYTQTLQIRREKIILIFDKEIIDGDLKDFMKPNLTHPCIG